MRPVGQRRRAAAADLAWQLLDDLLPVLIWVAAACGIYSLAYFAVYGRWPW